jgi:hypothetical protein
MSIVRLFNDSMIRCRHHALEVWDGTTALLVQQPSRFIRQYRVQLHRGAGRPTMLRFVLCPCALCLVPCAVPLCPPSPILPSPAHGLCCSDVRRRPFGGPCCGLARWAMGRWAMAMSHGQWPAGCDSRCSCEPMPRSKLTRRDDAG